VACHVHQAYQETAHPLNKYVLLIRMDGSAAAASSTGLTRYHYVGLIVPLLAALSQILWMRMTAIHYVPRPVSALIAGVIVGTVSYLIFKCVPFLKETSSPLGKAVVLGLLTAEVFVFHAVSHLPPASSIFLFLFLYTFSAETADGLD